VKAVRIVMLACTATIVAAVLVVGLLSHPISPANDALAANPYLDAGTALSGPAPGFTLTDQFGHAVSLRSYRGRAVLLAFIDARCTTICPLTSAEMLDAQRLLGPAGRRVALLGIDANPTATAVGDVRAYSRVHGMLRSWRFLTGSSALLKRVWREYHIAVQIEAGQIDHTPALYAIAPDGRLARIYLTELAYAGIDQQAQLLAQELARLLPDHPRVRSSLPYSPIKPIAPTASVRLALARDGARDAGGASAAAGASAGRAPARIASTTRSTTIRLGPDRAPRLLLFFATWDSEVGNLRAQLVGLGRYATLARHTGLPAPTAIDEGSVEPSPAALGRLLDSLPQPLPYPVAVDRSGRVADGYGVEDQPWLTLVSGAGRILWGYDASANGWPSTSALTRDIRAALTHPAPPRSAAAAAGRRRLAGSPARLAALHAQAGELIGGAQALRARLRALRGYPVVLNVWASWCTPCQAEFPLFASASARYGRQTAFLGADVEDSPANARAFLADHRVSYPSYESLTSVLRALAPVSDVPMTVFVDPAGQTVHVHIGQYGSQAELDRDIEGYG